MMQVAAQTWKQWQKIAFRFLFLFLGGSSIICWDLSIFFAFSLFHKGPGFVSLEIIYSPLTKPFHWLDKYIFHTGYDPKLHMSLPADNHFGVVFYLALLTFAILGTVIWSIFDSKRAGYNRLFYWFNVYLRYALSIVMFGYGIDKFIPVQMAYPSAVDLLTRLGEQDRFSVLWNFMGASPGFQIFSGACEIVASLLLLFRRTAVAGYIFMTGILCNVVAFNIFYNVSVKFFSSQLLLYSLYLLAPYLRGLAQFFFYNQPVRLSLKYFLFQTRPPKIFMKILLVIIVVVFFVFPTINSYNRYNKGKKNLARQRIYEVSSFVMKDTLPALITDTLRWQRFVFAYSDYAVIFNMQDKQGWYHCDVDSIKKTFRLHEGTDTIKCQVLHYEYPTKDQLLLTGKWKDNDIRVLLKSTSIDSLPLNKEKIILIQD